MREHIDIGSSPSDEDCAQVGEEGYFRRSSIECRAFVNQLKRQFPRAQFAIITEPHDFGSYRSVVATFETHEEMEAAIEAEANSPREWDAEALEEIKRGMGPRGNFTIGRSS